MLELPFSVKTLNPQPEIAKYFNQAGTPYTDVTQALTELTSGIRHIGLTVNIAGVEYWFKDGVLDIDLVTKISDTPSWQDTIDVDKNADRARLSYEVFKKGLFGGYAGAAATTVIQDPTTDRLYVYGYFTTYDGVTVNHIVALLPSGEIDPTFMTGTGFNSFAYTPTKLAIQPDGKIIFVGESTSYDSQASPRVFRLNTDGSLDTTFTTNLGTGSGNYTLSATLDSLGKVYITGAFPSFNGNGGGRLVRLNTDGTLDGGFVVGAGFNNDVINMAVDSNDDIYVSGYFVTYKGSSAPKIVKIDSTGTIDASFNPGTGFNTGNLQPNQVFITSDEQLMVIGYFTLYNGQVVNKAVKLNLDGTIDTSFEIQGTGFNGTHISKFIEDSEGNYIFSGNFTNYNGETTLYSVILDTTGNIVRTFPTFTECKLLLSDGRILAQQWNGSASFLGILEDNRVVNVKEFDYSEVDGKARYKVGGLQSIEAEEIMPKRLIQEMIDESVPAAITSTSELVNDGEDGLNPFITTNDLPEYTSALINDGSDGINPYLTANDIPEFEPSDYDLDEFNNFSLDPYVRQSELPIIPAQTSDLTNDGEDGINPFISSTIEKLFTVSLAQIGASDITDVDDVRTKLRAYTIAEGLSKPADKLHRWEIVESITPPIPIVPTLVLVTDDLDAFATSIGITDVNDVAEWNGLSTGAEALHSADFDTVEIIGDTVTLSGGLGSINSIVFSGHINLISFSCFNLEALGAVYVIFGNLTSIGNVVNCPTINNIQIDTNSLTTSGVDSGLLNWATNEAVTGGVLNFSTNAEDLTTSDTYDVLVNTKSWTP